MARALEVPLYELFHDGQQPPKIPNNILVMKPSENPWGVTGGDGRYLIGYGVC